MTRASERARPLVSIIVPAYNSVRTLPETLRSAASQTYAPIEILIVDDGSTDETQAIAREFCTTEPRARLIVQPNGGVAAARNTGIAAAKGEWVAPLDADDLWHPTKIERQVEAALAAPEPPGFVYCWFHLIDENNRVIGSSEAHYARGRTIDQLLYFNFVGNGSSLLIRRDAIESVGGYEIGFKQFGGCEDLDMQLRLARRFRVEPAPEFLIGYRLVSGSMSSDRTKMQRSWQRALQLFEESGGRINRKAVRWNSAYRALRMAESLARSGDRSGALRQTMRALRLDPARSSAKLAHRLLSAARGKLVGRRRRREPIDYYDAPTTRPIPSNPDEIRAIAEWLARWDKRRMASFANE